MLFARVSSCRCFVVFVAADTNDVMMAHSWIRALLSAPQKKLLRPEVVKTKSILISKRSELDFESSFNAQH